MNNNDSVIQNSNTATERLIWRKNESIVCIDGGIIEILFYNVEI